MALVLILACASAGADEVADARALVRKGDAAAAFALLEPLERTRAGEVDFDYLLGVAAYDSGRYDRAVVAFERALVASPGFFSARFDLARAYFALGADDLAQQEFERLLKANPTPEGVAAIRAHLEAIERRRKGPGRRFKAYVEAGGGHDSNLSSTTPDFTTAIGAAFGIPGVVPTGNSILRSAAFYALNGGAGAALPLAPGFEAIGSVDLKARNYSRYGEFDYRLADAQLGVAWGRDGASIQATVVGQAFRQDGAAPVALDGSQPSSDRNAFGGNLEARRALGDGWEIFAIGQVMRLRYPDNATQDTDQAYASVGVLRTTRGGWPGLALANVFYSKDRARYGAGDDYNGAPAIDVGRHTLGLRAYVQRDFARGAYGFALASWSRRVDDAPFARATGIEIGRDRLAELTLGAVCPWGRWSLRPGVTYLRNASNIELYSFRRTEGSLMVRYEFP
jgi:tetratricopeptide (TPR) repeat protein